MSMNHEFTRSTRKNSLNPEYSESRLKADAEKKRRTAPCKYHLLHDYTMLGVFKREIVPNTNNMTMNFRKGQ